MTYAYDAASRTLGVRNAKSDGTAISGFQYGVDDVGNPTGMVLANGDRVTWTYDSLYRLTREQRDGSNAYDMTYSYDASSNRLTKAASGVTTTYCYDEADRLLTENTAGALTTYSWDDAGNNTLMQSAGGTTTMTWDTESRMRTIQVAGGSVVTNTYGADGLRRKREEGAATVKHVWDGQRLLLESDGADATLALYTAGLGAYGPIVSMRRGAASRFLHPDHLGSIWNLTDASGDITDWYLFDAWGNVLASSGSTTNPLQYAGALGYYREPALALGYVRARWLRPTTGAWVSVDPVEGQKRYGYAGGRAARASDPSGARVIFDDPAGVATAEVRAAIEAAAADACSKAGSKCVMSDPLRQCLLAICHGGVHISLIPETWRPCAPPPEAIAWDPPAAVTTGGVIYLCAGNFLGFVGDPLGMAGIIMHELSHLAPCSLRDPSYGETIGPYPSASPEGNPYCLNQRCFCRIARQKYNCVLPDEGLTIRRVVRYCGQPIPGLGGAGDTPPPGEEVWEVIPPYPCWRRERWVRWSR